MYKPNQLADGKPGVVVSGHPLEFVRPRWKVWLFRSLVAIEVILTAIFIAASLWRAQAYAPPSMFEPGLAQLQYGIAPGVGPSVAP